MISVVLCKVSQPSRLKPKSYDGKFALAKCSCINYGATLSLVVTFENCQNFPCLSVCFDLKQFNRNKLWCPPKRVPFALFNYSSLSYIVLFLSSAVTKLPNKTLIFHDFQGPTIKFHDFPGLENEILKFHDFPGFP